MSIERIVMHCSASGYGTALDIDNWHKANGWSRIGYNLVITNGIPSHECYKLKLRYAWGNGQVEWGRSFNDNNIIEPHERGAHTLGLNSRSLGICMIGGRSRTGKMNDFTPEQFHTARHVLLSLTKMLDIPFKNVIGHREFDSGKECPCFNMDYFREFLVKPQKIVKLIDHGEERIWANHEKYKKQQ